MTVPDFQLPSPPSERIQVEALRAAFGNRYVFNVIRFDNQPARFEAVSRDGGNPYCVISTDAKEIWAALKAALGPAPQCGS